MRSAQALLTLADNEGGPFPVLEALGSGTPVVATPTGFCPDLVNHSNGVLLPNHPKLLEIVEALQYAISIKELVYNIDLLAGNFSWAHLGGLLYSSEMELN